MEMQFKGLSGTSGAFLPLFEGNAHLAQALCEFRVKGRGLPSRAAVKITAKTAIGTLFGADEFGEHGSGVGLPKPPCPEFFKDFAGMEGVFGLSQTRLVQIFLPVDELAG